VQAQPDAVRIRIRFQLDEDVPHAVAGGLRRRGIDVATTTDADLLEASDLVQLARARVEMRVIVTHDSDFLRLHDEGHPHTGIAYCAQGARSIGELIQALALMYEVLEPGDMVGQVEFL